MADLKQAVATLRTRLEAGRRRAEAAEAQVAELQRLVDEKGRKVNEMEERLRLTREANTILKYLVPVLQKLHDAEVRLKQRVSSTSGAEAKYNALNAQIDELQVKFDAIRKEKKELEEMLAELHI